MSKPNVTVLIPRDLRLTDDPAERDQMRDLYLHGAAISAKEGKRVAEHFIFGARDDEEATRVVDNLTRMSSVWDFVTSRSEQPD